MNSRMSIALAATWLLGACAGGVDEDSPPGTPNALDGGALTSTGSGGGPDDGKDSVPSEDEGDEGGPGGMPGGDILPDQWAAGVTADQKRFEFGAMGPGCTGQDEMGNFTGQAIPPVRIREVCESLDRTDENGEALIRCCMESICDTDYSDAINCLTGIVQNVIAPG